MLSCSLCEMCLDDDYYERYKNCHKMIPETDIFIPIINEYLNGKISPLSQYPTELTLCGFCKNAIYINYPLFTEAGRLSIYDFETERTIKSNLQKLFKDYKLKYLIYENCDEDDNISYNCTQLALILNISNKKYFSYLVPNGDGEEIYPGDNIFKFKIISQNFYISKN